MGYVAVINFCFNEKLINIFEAARRSAVPWNLYVICVVENHIYNRVNDVSVLIKFHSTPVSDKLVYIYHRVN